MENIKVADVYKIFGNASEIVARDATLEYVIDRFAKNPSLRRVFLVDNDRRYCGELSNASLMKWVKLLFFDRKHDTGKVPAWELYRLITATKAIDLSRGNWQELQVRESDSLQTALAKMIDYETNTLPVVDVEGKVLGDLRFSEVIAKTIEAGQ